MIVRGYVDKFVLLDFLDGIAGGENARLTLAGVFANRKVIIRMVSVVRAQYESRMPGDPYMKYYEECWRMFDAAKSGQEIMEAIEYLRSSIRWE
jgi:hypothetical protein